MVRNRKRVSLYPKRIAGISFSEDDYNRIQAICAEGGMAEAQVIRGAVAAGLVVFEGGLQSRIAQVSTELGLTETQTMRGAVEEGLDQFLVKQRSRNRVAMLQEFEQQLGSGNEELKTALRDYLQKETLFQETIDTDEDEQEEEDKEQQRKFDELRARQPQAKSVPPDSA